MKQTSGIISTYTADVMGVCSALFELGGMCIMHDASGCNSTYNTHDEPRWYDSDSLVFISGISEMEAVMGDDEKLINDIAEAAQQLSPKFIAISGTPVPMMIGTDFKAISSIIEKRCGIPTFGFGTNGMHSYISGAAMAFEAVADRLTDRNVPKTEHLSVNILGLTPLDFSVNSSVDSIKKYFTSNGVEIISTFAMGSSLDEIKNAGAATVNLVVSYCGLAAAKKLRKLYGTPYVIGVPIGDNFSARLLEQIHTAAADCGCITDMERIESDGSQIAIIGESVFSCSLAAALSRENGGRYKVISPLECEGIPGAVFAEDEDDIIPQLKGADIIIADPLYKPICPSGAKFVSLPHEAFSGRIFRKDIPDLISGFDIFKQRVQNN